eukprot:841629-Amphidinium_carterae.1
MHLPGASATVWWIPTSGSRVWLQCTQRHQLRNKVCVKLLKDFPSQLEGLDSLRHICCAAPPLRRTHAVSLPARQLAPGQKSVVRPEATVRVARLCLNSPHCHCN